MFLSKLKIYKKKGEAAQVHNVPQILPDAGRFKVAHVRAQRDLAVPLLRLQKGLQQTDQFAEPSLPPYRFESTAVSCRNLFEIMFIL